RAAGRAGSVLVGAVLRRLEGLRPHRDRSAGATGGGRVDVALARRLEPGRRAVAPAAESAVLTAPSNASSRRRSRSRRPSAREVAPSTQQSAPAPAPAPAKSAPSGHVTSRTRRSPVTRWTAP